MFFYLMVGYVAVCAIALLFSFKNAEEEPEAGEEKNGDNKTGL